ncbi:MAG: hypothetical protein LQ351_001387 [Letrouitia transgressa]|nr:MAG: hypothetical protein LQ351_001387 [Letrouitia transgressa]
MSQASHMNERELEKVNAFYLQKEAELKLRLRTLLDKKRVLAARGVSISKTSANFITLEEGFQQFGNDLNKLQQFVDTNATAFSKILKKSRTKELYLSRAVDVQPCFNRDVISELSDQATTSLLELGAWADGERVRYGEPRTSEHIISWQSVGNDQSDIDSQLLQATLPKDFVVLQDWVKRLRESSDAKLRLTRTFLGAIADASEAALGILLESGLIDFHAEDEVNERNCLHEAAISGRRSILDVGLNHGVDLSRVDVYGRIPLHYACIHGHVGMVEVLVEQGPRTVDEKDHDSFTPLIHAVIHHHLVCVEKLLDHGSRIDPQDDTNHIPLNLACQYGSLAVTKLLLEREAKISPDAEGLFPQHLVARSGQSPEILYMLEDHGANLDQQDKLYQWTPLFHAAAEGHVECLKALLHRGADMTILDEKGLSAMYYAAWEGNMECMRFLGLTDAKAHTVKQFSSAPPGSLTHTGISTNLEGDGIPDLSLPPPIIPLRRYGHNFLDNQTFIQISFEANGSEAIMFYHDSKYPAARLTISSKNADIIPRNIMLPIQEGSKIVSFQIDHLESFNVDFDIYPTFGSKIIARSVGLPDIFSAVQSSSGHCCLPLFDPRLRAIGQISFDFLIIKPFQGIPLEIAHFATYWKAISQLDSHPNSFITGSSLSGNYVQMFVQLTSDGMPILYPTWDINFHGIQLPICRLSYDQFVSLRTSRTSVAETLATLSECSENDLEYIHQILATSWLTFKDALKHLPLGIRANVSLLFPTSSQEKVHGLSPRHSINSYVDAVLTDVFDHARMTRELNPGFMRSIVFTSYNTDICIALNWKQPNYPVLHCNDLGSRKDSSTAGPTIRSSGHSSLSVKEAVRIAQSNNFMGLVCNSRLLRLIPPLIESIKVAGLVLVTNVSDEPGTVGTARERNYRMPEGLDGMLRGDGILRFNDSIDM